MKGIQHIFFLGGGGYCLSAHLQCAISVILSAGIAPGANGQDWHGHEGEQYVSGNMKT